MSISEHANTLIFDLETLAELSISNHPNPLRIDKRNELRTYIASLEKCRDGYRLIDKYPNLNDWVLVKFVPGFIQPYKVVQYIEDKWGNRRFGVHMDRQIERWWELPK